MKWAFIDYENIGTLKGLDLSIYERVIIFIGANQRKINICDEKYTHPVNITLVKMDTISPNNLDFHLSFYLGKFANEAPENIEFEVITNDNGFMPLITHINSSGRACEMKRTYSTVRCPIILFERLSGILPEKRPKKLIGLANYINHHMKLRSGEDATKYIEQLVSDQLIIVNNSDVQYTSRLNRPM